MDTINLKVSEVIAKMFGEKRGMMMQGIRILKLFFGVFIIILSGYSLITQDFTLAPFNMFLLAMFMFAVGITEFQKKQILNGVITIIASLLVSLVFLFYEFII